MNQPAAHPPLFRNIIFSASILTLIGTIFIAVSSLNEAKLSTGNELFFIKRHLIWLPISLIAYFIGFKFNLNLLKKNIKNLFYLFIFLLVLVLIPQFGIHALGANRWLNLGFIGFQPTDFFKIVAILFFAQMFTNPDSRNIKTLLYFLCPAIALIVLEPNLSTAILISAITISLYYLSGGDILSLFTLSLLAVLISTALVFTSPYRLKRLNALVNPNPQSQESYHTNQIILAISSGGVFGKGIGNSEQKNRFLPKIVTDSIVAIIGEETGFVGLMLLITTYIFLVNGLLKISSMYSDLFSSLVTGGIALWIGFQSLMNLSAIAAIIPLTGIPLPFVSYGGSSMVSLWFSIGLAHNIYLKSSLLYSNNSEKKPKNYHHRQPSHSRN